MRGPRREAFGRHTANEAYWKCRNCIHVPGVNSDLCQFPNEGGRMYTLSPIGLPLGRSPVGGRRYPPTSVYQIGAGPMGVSRYSNVPGALCKL